MSTKTFPGKAYKDPKNKVGIGETAIRIAKKTGFNKKDTLAMINAFQEVVFDIMAENKCLHMNKLGKFTKIKKMRLGVVNYRIRFTTMKSIKIKLRAFWDAATDKLEEK